MRRRPRKARPRAAADPQLTRTDALLAQVLLHFMGDAGLKKKALALQTANLSNAAIAQLVGTSPEVVAQVLYQARRERARPKGRGKRRR